ncbi:hypothetical protein EYF80_032838 [Liparis tanakae]|uniref:Uncharacterized protein n=1 Tax=Liparis tanakae TaxID=230148 RepID=A0A4Z2GUM8_9TELE|nr:hypothetical protein EYF80_032838 [Liparis tanakae]
MMVCCRRHCSVTSVRPLRSSPLSGITEASQYSVTGLSTSVTTEQHHVTAPRVIWLYVWHALSITDSNIAYSQKHSDTSPLDNTDERSSASSLCLMLCLRPQLLLLLQGLVLVHAQPLSLHVSLPEAG